MFKRFVSSLIIISILWVDVVAAMDSPGGRPPSDGDSSRSTVAKQRSGSESPPKEDSSTRTLTGGSPPRERSEKEPLLPGRVSALPVASRASLEGDVDGRPSPPPIGSIQGAGTPDPDEEWLYVKAPAREEGPGWNCFSWLWRCCRRAPAAEDVTNDARDIDAHSRAPSFEDEEEAASDEHLLKKDNDVDLTPFVQKVSELDPNDPVDKAVLSFLRFGKKHINEGSFTWKQIVLASTLGGYIAYGVAKGMIPILGVGLRDLGKNVRRALTLSETWTTLFGIHTGVTLGIDAASRNMRTLAAIAAPSPEGCSIPAKKMKIWKFELDPHKAIIGGVYMGGAVAGLLPAFYLWEVEKGNIVHVPSIREATFIYIGCFAPALFLDALFTNARAMQAWLDEKLTHRLIHHAFGEETRLSPTHLARTQTLQDLKGLERLFRDAPDSDIHDYYEQVLRHGFNIQNNKVDIPEDNISAAETLRTLAVLKKIHRTSEIPEEAKDTWKNTTATVLGRGIPGLATVARTLVFYTMIYSLLEDAELSIEWLKIGLAAVFGGGVAASFQGRVEVDTVTAGVYEALLGEETEGDARQSCLGKGLRRAGKLYGFAQGVWNTLPYVLVGMKATSGWSVALLIATLPFFGIADMFNNGMSFNDSYGGVINSAESVLSYKYETAHYKRQKLRRMTRDYKDIIAKMPPDVLMRLVDLSPDGNRSAP